MKRHGNPQVVATDRLKSYKAGMKLIGNADRQETGRWTHDVRASGARLIRTRQLSVRKPTLSKAKTFCDTLGGNGT
jgi:putative transposase